jgi:sulfhydrogenase subunit beta (sulfur reductase)
MSDTHTTHASILPKARFDDLIGLLHRDGLEVIGPRIEQQAIVYGPLHSAADLPVGWTDRQEPGIYRLEKRADNSYFGYAVGPHSWKKYLFPPTLRLWQARRMGNGVEVRAEEPVPPRRAFLGIRSCELHAIGVQDRVFLNRPGDLSDPHYARAREQLFLVAVECQHPAGTCFCVFMHTGPAIDPGRRPLPVLTSPPDTAAEGNVSTRYRGGRLAAGVRAARGAKQISENRRTPAAQLLIFGAAHVNWL